MKTKIKNLFLCGAAVLLVGLVSAGTVVSTNAQVSADDAPSTFEMLEGASLRLNGESGIRYQAKISTDIVDMVNANEKNYFGMIVIPESYLTKFGAELEAGNNDYVTVLTQELKDEGYTLWNRTEIEPYVGQEANKQDPNYYYMNGVVSNVLYENYDVRRMAIAYYAIATENDSEVTYTYEYADFYTEDGNEKTYNNLRSVVEVAEGTLKGSDNLANKYNEDSRKVLYGYQYVSEYKKAMLTEPTDDAVEAYGTNCVKSENSKTLLTFDEADSSANYKVATKTSNAIYKAASEASTFSVENGVLSIVSSDSSKKYTGVSLMFRPVKVVEGLTFNVQVKANPGQLRCLPLNSTADANTAKSYDFTPGNWSTVSVSATELGYAVGDLVSGLDFYKYFSMDYYTFQIDSVEIEYKPVLADNELVNFDGALVDYSGNILEASTTSAVNNSYSWYPKTISRTLLHVGDEGYEAPANSAEDNGVVKVTSNGGGSVYYGGVKLAFNKALTVTPSTVIGVSCYAVCSSVYVENKAATALVTVATPTQSTWTMIYVHPKALGYADSETVTSIEIFFEGAKTSSPVMYIDKVSIESNELINFDNKLVNYAGNILGHTVPSSQVDANYAYHGADAYSELLYKDDEGYKAPSGSSEDNGVLKCTPTLKGGSCKYGGVIIGFDKRIAVTAETTITVNCYIATQRLNLLNKAKNALVSVTAPTPNTWTTFSVKLTDLGYVVGDELKEIGIFFDSYNESYMYIDSITYVG